MITIAIVVITMNNVAAAKPSRRRLEQTIQAKQAEITAARKAGMSYGHEPLNTLMGEMAALCAQHAGLR